MRRGSFGFILDGSEKSVGYVAEKLGLAVNVTSKKITELINGIITMLKE